MMNLSGIEFSRTNHIAMNEEGLVGHLSTKVFISYNTLQPIHHSLLRDLLKNYTSRVFPLFMSVMTSDWLPHIAPTQNTQGITMGLDVGTQGAGKKGTESH